MTSHVETASASASCVLDRKTIQNGTHRVTTIEHTLARAEAAARVIGVTRVANQTGIDRLGLPVYSVVAPAMNPGRRMGMVTVASGKGITDAHARASALMELIERWSAMLRDDDVVVRGSRASLASTFNLVDQRFNPRNRAGSDDVVDWAEVVHLRSGEPALAPLPLVYGASSSSTGSRACFAGATSNGLASGNTLAEATVHGLYELIERDAAARTVTPGRRLALTDLDAPPPLRNVIERLARERVELVVRELASPTGIASFAATCIDRELTGWRAVVDGFGTHLDPLVAVTRAVTETAQARVLGLVGACDDLFRKEADLGLFNLDAELDRRADWLSNTDAAASIRDFPDASTDTISGDLGVVLDRLSDAGFDDVYTKDLTRPETGIPVVRVIVPGLRFGSAS